MNLATPELGVIFWQTITFLVLLLVLRAFAWKKILNALETREKRIQGALVSAKEAKRQLDAFQEKSKKIIEHSNIEKERIIKEGIAEKEYIVEHAKLEAQKIKEEATKKLEKSIEKQKRMAVIEIKNDVADLVIKVAEKLLMEKMQDSEVQKRSLMRIIDDMPEAS